MSQDAATYIRSGLIKRGFKPHIADAYILNMRSESGLDPGINEARPLVPGSRGGFGLNQWTGPRRRQLEGYAKERGIPASDIDLQLDFLSHELETSERSAAAKIDATNTVGEAADAIVRHFLRPAPEHMERRSAQYLRHGDKPVVQPLANRSDLMKQGVDPGFAHALAKNPPMPTYEQARPTSFAHSRPSSQPVTFTIKRGPQAPAQPAGLQQAASMNPEELKQMMLMQMFSQGRSQTYRPVNATAPMQGNVQIAPHKPHHRRAGLSAFT